MVDEEPETACIPGGGFYPKAHCELNIIELQNTVLETLPV